MPNQMAMEDGNASAPPPAVEFARDGAQRLAEVNPRVWIVSAIVVLLALVSWGGYSLIAPMFAPDEAPPPDLRGTFMVRFEENSETLTERAFINDQTTHSFEYPVTAMEGWAVSSVVVSVHFGETDEAGVGFCDDVSAQLELAGVTGGSEIGGQHDGQSNSCNDALPQIVLDADVNPEYDGQDYSAENVLVEEIDERWRNGGKGIGTYVNDVTVQIRTFYDITESGEEVEVTWTVTTYRWIIETPTE